MSNTCINPQALTKLSQTKDVANCYAARDAPNTNSPAEKAVIYM